MKIELSFNDIPSLIEVITSQDLILEQQRIACMPTFTCAGKCAHLHELMRSRVAVTEM